MDNLFRCLFRWAHGQGENYLTDAFVYLVRLLLVREPDIGSKLLCWLCFQDSELPPGFGPVGLTITTQQAEEEGTPDIRLEWSEGVILIEVKKDADLHPGQLKQYRDILGKLDKVTKRLILLTKAPIAFAPGEDEPDVHLRWHQVATKLEQATCTDPVATYLVAEFLAFLQAEVMMIERVDREYLEGAKAMRRFVGMLGEALEVARISIYRNQASWDSIGYFIEGGKLLICIYYDEPEYLRVRFYKPDHDPHKHLQLGKGCILDGKLEFRTNLNAEEGRFFTVSKEEQLELLAGYVKELVSDARSCLP